MLWKVNKMATKQRLIDKCECLELLGDAEQDALLEDECEAETIGKCIRLIKGMSTVDAVEVPDKELLKAIKLLIKQYEHSKKSDYVHSPVAHAFYHAWKKLDAKMDGDGNENT